MKSAIGSRSASLATPPSVLSGRLDQTRDWFASAPVALTIKDGIIISAKESDAAQTPGP
jgi:hypothetical protein